MVHRSTPGRDLDSPISRIASLVEELEQLPENPARERARALVQAVLEMHAAGLARILELAAAHPDGPAFIDELCADPMVTLLMSLHELHPSDVETRVRAAVDGLKPVLLDEGVAIELDRASEGTARVRLRAAGAIRASDARIRARMEAAMAGAAPEIAAIEIDGLDGAPLVPAGRLVAPRR